MTKISNLKRQYETKHRHFEETFPQNSEVRTTKINALISSYQAASRILVITQSIITVGCCHMQSAVLLETV